MIYLLYILLEFRHVEEQLYPHKTQAIPRIPNDSGLQCYSMYKRPHGVCAIFNNSNFNTEALGKRKGSEIDRDRLYYLFSQLQYNVEVYNDLTTGIILVTSKSHYSLKYYIMFLQSSCSCY